MASIYIIGDRSVVSNFLSRLHCPRFCTSLLEKPSNLTETLCHKAEKDRVIHIMFETHSICRLTMIDISTGRTAKGAQTLQGHISCEKSLTEKATATQTKTEKPRWTIRSLSTTTGSIHILQEPGHNKYPNA